MSIHVGDFGRNFRRAAACRSVCLLYTSEFIVIDEIDCDHDLGEYASDGGDGIKLINWLAERKTYYPVRLHTMNPVGRENMQREIDRYWNARK